MTTNTQEDELDHILGNCNCNNLDMNCWMMRNNDPDFIQYLPEKQKTAIEALIQQKQLEAVKTALESMASEKLILFGKLQALEGKRRADYLETTPLKYVYVFKSRQQPLRNGSTIDPLTNKLWASSTMAFAWFVWEKGYEGNPQIKWLDTTRKEEL